MRKPTLLRLRCEWQEVRISADQYSVFNAGSFASFEFFRGYLSAGGPITIIHHSPFRLSLPLSYILCAF